MSMSICLLVGWSVGRSDSHFFLTGREDTLLSFYHPIFSFKVSHLDKGDTASIRKTVVKTKQLR